MTWFIFALVACISQCSAIEITRRTKLDGFEVLLYRCLISGFLLLPFFMYMSWPANFRFYIVTGLSSVIYVWGNIILTNLAARKNGRVAMMFQPMTIFATFCAWLIIRPEQIALLTKEPQEMGITLLCFALLFGSLHFIRRNDYAWTSLLTVAPVAIGFGLMNVAQTWLLGSGTNTGSLGTILAILMVGNFGMVAVLPFFSHYRVRTEELQITHHAVFPVFTIGLIGVLHMTTWGLLLHAMNTAENPAYPVAIMALAPVVFQTYYWIQGWRDNASPIAGAAMTFSALVLGLIHA